MLKYSYIFQTVLYNIYHISSYIVVYRLYKYFPQLKHWEQALPKHYVVASTPSLNSLSLKVEIQTTDTAEVKGVTALLDSGATGLFIDQGFATAKKLTMRPLTLPAPVCNIDGTPNEGGAIQNVVNVILRF